MKASTYIVIAMFEKGVTVKAVGLAWDEAHDLREQLMASGLYTRVLVGSVGTYFAI